MKKITIRLLITLFLMAETVSGQVTGDYRTAASGNWNVLTTWQMFNGTTWITASVKPGTTNNVLIGNGFNVTVNTNETCKDLIIQDGSTLTLSHNIVNSGNVSIGGTIDFGVSTLQNKGGGGSNENFTIGGSPVSLSGDVISGSPNIVIGGVISGVVPGMTITGTSIPLNTCILSVSGFTLIMSQAATSSASNQTFTIKGANTIITSNPLGIDGSIIQISRNFMDGASYIINAATTTPFPASTTITAKNLAVNGSITLNTPVTVNGTMTLNAGNILTTSTAGLLTLGPAANFIGGSSTSFINGPLQLTNSSVSQTTFVFPIGKETSYRPVSLTLTQNSTTPTTYKAEVFNTPPINRNLPSTLDRISFVRYFNIIKGAGANVSSAQITINYDVTGIDDGVTNATNLRLAKDDGLGNWIDLGGDNTSINFTGSITPSGSLITFGDFTLANNSGGSNLLGGQVPVQPLPVNPANLTVNVPINITLVWGNSTGAATYRLLVATDPGFSNIILDDSTLTDITRPVGPLQNNTKYYWKINGKNFLGTGVFSTTFNFTTIVSIPGIPVLATPSNGTVNQPLRPTLTWNSVPLSESYRVQVSTDSAFNSLIVNDSLVTATSLLISPLSGFSKYYWKVKAVNVAGTGGYSAPFNFMTVLSAPQLLLPTNGETQGFTWQHFIWSPVNGAVSYHFQLAKDSIFSVIVVDDSALIVDTAEAKLLTLNTKYYWRVLAKNPQSQSDYSTIFNFIAAITGINDKTGTTPNVYNLYQNYPNPFNPSTVIRYDLPNESVVNLQLYNSIGQLVKVLISSPQSAGVHDITFNSSGLSSGVYIYTLSAKPVSGGQQFRFIKKMLLLK